MEISIKRSPTSTLMPKRGIELGTFCSRERCLTARPQLQLIRNGYLYVFKKMFPNDVKCYECILRRKDGQCKVLIKLDENHEFVGQVNENTHAQSQTEFEVTKEVTKVKASIKIKAVKTTDTLQQLLGTQLRNISENAAANLPSSTSTGG